MVVVAALAILILRPDVTALFYLRRGETSVHRLSAVIPTVAALAAAAGQVELVLSLSLSPSTTFAVVSH